MSSAVDRQGAGIDRRVLLIWGLIALGGLLIRLWNFDGLAIEHFDEGVYASTILFDESQGGEYPSLHLYAPPLFPELVFWAKVFLGSGPAGNFAVSVALGTALIAAAGCVAHRWFGPRAGIVAAVLMAFSDPFVVYSRACLTDVPLCLWWVAAFGLLREALIRESRLWGVAAGIAVALAWWTKYNGWLPLALSFAAIIAWSVTTRTGWPAARRTLAAWGVAAATAIGLWSPVWWGLQDRGGYAAVAANHAGYFHGLAGWGAALVRQTENLRALETTAGRIVLGAVTAPSAGLLAMAAVVALFDRRRARRVAATPPGSEGSRAAASRDGAMWLSAIVAGVAALGVLVGLMYVLGSGGTLVLFGAAGCLLALGLSLHETWRIARGEETSPGVAGVERSEPPARRARGSRRKQEREPTESRFGSRRDPAALQALTVWLAAAWVFGMLALTPLYREYPRLTLPLLAGAIVGFGAFESASRAWRSRCIEARVAASGGGERAGSIVPIALMGLGAAGVVFLAPPGHRAAWPTWSRLGMRATAVEIAEASRTVATAASRGDPTCVVYVYAEPALFYHLRAPTESHPEGMVAGAAPVSGLAFAATVPPAPTFLAVGPHARRSPQFAEQWKEFGRAFEKVGEWPYEPSFLVLLDHHDPATVRTRREPITEAIELYRLK